MGRFNVSANSDTDKVRVSIHNDEGKHSFFETDADTARTVGELLIQGADHIEQAKDSQ